jgi:Flp pilus assembly pilin Flp
MGQRAGRVKQFFGEDEGLTSIEYALILMLLIILCLSVVRYLGYGTNVTAHNVTNRTTNAGGPPLPVGPALPPEPIEIIRSSQPTSFDGVLFVALICTVTACLFVATCVICFRISEWRAQQATLRKLRERTDEDKIDANLGPRVPRGRILDTTVDGPIQDRAVAPISPPEIVVSPMWWLAPNANLEARASSFAPAEASLLPPHPNMATAPAPGKVVVFDAASLAGVARMAPVNGGQGPVASPPIAPPDPPSDS